jgi:uncharacterized protein
MPLPLIVLDTNAVLDWLVFHDSSMTQITSAIQTRSIQWIATAAMRDELARVLTYPLLTARNPDAATVQTVWQQYAQNVPAPQPCALLCKDADDQKFIDLATDAHASWLISKDKALLALRKKASMYGVRIMRPQQWND